MACHFVITALLMLSCVSYMSAEEALTTKIHRAWAGGFQGIIEVPPFGSEVTDGWHLIVKFPHNVFEFEACPVQVMDFQDNRKGIDRPKSTLILANRPWNANLAADEPISFKFLAKTWNRRKGFQGEIEFVNSTYVEPMEPMDLPLPPVPMEMLEIKK